ncbi:MAG: hypothetical protein E6J88_08640 [Deltaproteobacteria bacterium]|nr:MAG: hypothetical protein E6J88_08640 [Deltaproteobacteria bacterium]
MKKTAKGLREMNRMSRIELVRAEAEQLEEQRIEFEHRARMLRTNLYNTSQQRDTGRGWVDASRK